MKSFLRLDEVKRTRPGASECTYESNVQVDSQTLPGVKFTIHRISFGRRMELCRRVREIGQRLEFLEAGEEFREKVEANLLSHEIDRIYLEWGLVGIEGLKIDGEPASGELVAEKGPEALTKEIIDAIKSQCGLSEEERKN